MAEWKPVCFEGWDNSWSDAVCKQLGFAEAQLTQFNIENNMLDSQFWLRDPSMGQKKQPIQAAVLSSAEEVCSSKAKVELSCESFGKSPLKTLIISNYVILRMWSMGYW